MRGLSIRTQLLLLAAVAAIPLLAAEAFDVYSDLEKARQSTRTNLRALVSAMEATVTGRLLTAQAALQRVASEERAADGGDVERCERLLTEVLLSCRQCADLFLTDAQGTVRCAGEVAGGERRTGALADAPWYRQLRARGTFTVSNPVDDALTGERVVIASLPQLAPDGALLGAAHMTLRLELLDPRLPGALLPANSRFAFVAPDRVLVWRNVDPDGAIGHPYSTDYVVPLLDTPSGDLEVKGTDGVVRSVSSVKMPLTGWVATIGVPAASVRVGPMTEAGSNLRSLALAMALLVLFAMVLARRIASPIVELERVAREARLPGFSGTAKVGGSREVSAVAEAFNALLGERRDREAELRAFLDNSAVIAWMKDRDGRYVFASRYFLQRFALSPERLLGKTDADVWPAEAAERFRAWDARVLAEERTFEYVKQIPNPDGSTSTWHTSKFLFKAPDGRLLVGAVGVDITQRQAAEEARRASDQRLETIFDASPIGMSLGNLANEYLRVNQAFCKMLGRSEAELIALGPFGITAPGDQEIGREEVAALLSGKKQSSTSEKRYLHKSGREVWVLRTLSVVRDAQGRPQHYLAQVQDISERKAAEESARLAVVGTLAAGAAHEINNPLTYVLGNLAWVRDELKELAPRVPPSDQRRLVEALEALLEAHGGAERIAHIIAGLKTFSRKSDQPAEPTDVRAVMESALQLTVAQRRNQARTETRFAPAPRALASPRQLEQVFINLLVNAAQAIPEGKADEHCITVSVRSGEGGVVVAEVTDTGVGMSEDVKRHLFEPFFTTKPIGAGTGLGLSTCHGIVKSFGGRIEVESAPERGSTFRVVLPGLAPGEPLAPSEQPQVTPLPTRGRVLVIEDEAVVARGLARMLTGGPEVVVETDPRAALARLERGEAFDLVLCDLMMPSLSGEELQRALQVSRPAVAEALVFMTGGAFTAGAASFLATTRNTCLQKPLEASALRALVAERLAAPAAVTPGP